MNKVMLGVSVSRCWAVHGNIYAPEEDEDWTYKLEVVYFQILFFPLLLKIYEPLR